MGLFVPTSNTMAAPPFTDIELVKGRLTNLDNNQFIGFQFNPAMIYEREFDWGAVQWLGSTEGGDLQYLGTGPYTFDLPLLYISEPPAPTMEASGPRHIAHPEFRVDFEALEKTINDWCKPDPALGRPARINVAFGRARYFNGVITRVEVELLHCHGDLTAREARLTLEFRQWETMINMQR